MTYKDYRKMVKQMKETDSRKEWSSLEMQIFNAAVDLMCSRIIPLEKKYMVRSEDDPLFRRGAFSFQRIDYDKVVLTYHPQPGHIITVDVPMRCLDDSKLNAYEVKLWKNMIRNLKSHIKEYENLAKRYHSMAETVKKELEKCLSWKVGENNRN